MDMRQFLENRQRFPLEELKKYEGRYIAWSPDGTRIVASDDDPLKLAESVKASGYDPADCVLSSVPFEDEIVLGGRLDG